MAHGWGNWYIRNIQDAGYPSETVEARLMTGGADSRPPPGPRVPHVMMPAPVAVVDRALRIMPSDYVTVMYGYYVDGNKVSRLKLTETLIWLDGHLKA